MRSASCRMPDEMEEFAAREEAPFQLMVQRLREGGFPFALHAHAATRTVDDAAEQLSFDVSRIVKTVAFRTRDGRIVLAALRGTRRVNYPRLAALLGINRRDLAPLSPEEVREILGVEPGGVSPLLAGDNTTVLLDSDILTILPTLYCGTGRTDRTFELSPEDLVTASGGEVGDFSRE
ncbi:YbaK/EbsC family protein [Geomonas sp. RF6]|uniref:aminoacyl-tRNA deacylase n=1 Tax=Geomonas sp. RF6 TaxID=2897342 RepID=UPI001E2B3E5C|nr:YbaK/EbsC family protein [Geomonas sp. RF6]UFS68811.1 YbaK/EbsC family protein [Geomonas sp. RF6]